MRTIVIASSKGGVGKTTLSAHLSVAAEASQAGPVVVMDTDPQASLAKWWNARAADTPGFASVKGTLPDTLAGLADLGTALVFIDTPPAMGASIAASVACADLVLIPVGPSPLDLQAVGATIDIATRTGRAWMSVLNKTRRNSVMTADTMAVLERHGSMAGVLVEDRLDYRTAMINGRTAQEYAPRGKAAQEIRDLWTVVEGKL